MRWFRIRGKINVIIVGNKQQSVPYCLQTGSKNLYEGCKGWNIRPIVPWDRKNSFHSVTDKKMKYMLFAPLVDGDFNDIERPEGNPLPFRTIKAAKAFAEEYQAKVDKK